MLIFIMREPITWVEIDIDRCQLVYGTAPCVAVLGTTGVRKCYNSFKTCQDKDNYDLGSITYKFYKPQSVIPKEVGSFPCLLSVSASEGTVNIAGTDDKISSFGKRERITVKMQDFPNGDVYSDKYSSGRIDGTAQTDEPGYKPIERGTFFGKLRSRNPYYAGRAIRVNEAFIDGGVLSNIVTRHYIITDMDVDVMGNTATFTAKDILTLADDKKAVAPKPSSGSLLESISADATTFNLSPQGIGAEYPSSGRVVVGTEIMDYTRSIDVMTVVRGTRNTDAASHSDGDGVQEVYSVTGGRIDVVTADLLVNYANVDPTFIDTVAWSLEADTWAPTLLLTADITKPTGVKKLIGELSVMGVSFWWDRQGQEVGFKVNHPPFDETIHHINDESNIKDVSVDDRDDDRLTQIAIYSVIANPTLSEKDGNSYKRLRAIVDIDAQSVNEFADTRIRQIFIRWLGDGNESLLRIIGKRLINRFRWSPSRYKIRTTYDETIKLADVLTVNSRITQDDTGNNVDRSMQVIGIKYDKPKHEMVITAQLFQFDQRYGRIAENSRPVYSLSSDEEKEKGIYFADNITSKMSDGTDAYKFV